METPFKHSLFFKISGVLLLFGGMALVLSAWISHQATMKGFQDQAVKEIKTAGEALAFHAERILHEKRAGKKGGESCEGLAKKIFYPLVVLDIKKGVICNPLKEEVLLSHPEVKTALKGITGVNLRFHRGAGGEVIQLAVPLRGTEGVAGVLHLTGKVPKKGGDQGWWQLAGLGVLLAFLGLALAFWVSQGVENTLNQLTEWIKTLGKGGPWNPPLVEDPFLLPLALSMTEMSREMALRLENLEIRREELEAVLSSMVESVVAVDENLHILNMNQSAIQLFGVGAFGAELSGERGRPLREVSRNPDLNAFVEKALAAAEPTTGELLLSGYNEQRVVQIEATPLKNPGKKAMGVLVVLHDLTEIRQLEQVRRDFIANVSHELRTPATAIKGYVEILTDGKPLSPEESKGFLQVVARQADRLNNIITDLLTLARIEEDARAGEIQLELTPLKPVIQAALETCALAAEKNNTPLELDCPDDTILPMAPHLLEQAVVNLVQNAIKYSPPKSPVLVRVKTRGGKIELSVKDQGAGIPRSHLPRLFERFYRVDRARSRELGGTGLGLAIVKHITQAHQGEIFVESTVGQGSTFIIRLPG